MKFTDRMFEFPIRVYDLVESKRAIEKGESTNTSYDGVWAPGKTKIFLEDLESYSDFFDNIHGIKGVKEEGFKNTIVFTKTGEYICLWTKEKFEHFLNEFADKYEQWMNSQFKNM